MNFTLHKGASKFSAIKYSEDKIKESHKSGLFGKNAKVELIGSRNFPIEDCSFLPAEAKEQVMLDYCLKSKVDIRQLHFTLSCRKHENSEYELKAAAEYLLDHMGYSRCPALFYIHRDTANLHLHVVTTKCDENGRKVADWKNAQRSHDCLDKYEGLNIEQNADRAIRLASSYHFTEDRHFTSLLASFGFQVSHRHEEVIETPSTRKSKDKPSSQWINNPDFLFLFRNRREVASVSIDKVKKLMELNRQKTLSDSDQKRRKELAAIMHDYRKREAKDFYTGKKPMTKAELRIEQKVRTVNSIHNDQMAKRGIMRNDLYQMALFQSDMKKEFGIDVIYNFDRTGVPNGFIVLDHQAKRVWRGSELGFKFKEFLRPDEKALREFIKDGRCREALILKDKEEEKGFWGAVSVETRIAQGGTAFLFYGLKNHNILPKNIGKSFVSDGVLARWLTHAEMKLLEKMGIKVKVYQSVYDSIPIQEPRDADKELSSRQPDKGTSLDEKSKSLSSRKTPIPRIDVGHFAETIGNVTETTSNVAGTAASFGLGMLESTLDTPTPTTAIGGGDPPKSLEGKKKKKKKR